MSIRVLSCTVLILGIALGLARPAAAVSVVEPIAFSSWRAEPNTFSVGGGAALGALSFDLVPTLEYVFEENSTIWAMNVDAHIPVMALPVVAFYVGAGIGGYTDDPKFGETESDIGVNLLVGTKATVRKLKPFGELKYTTSGPDTVVLTLGLRFSLRD